MSNNAFDEKPPVVGDDPFASHVANPYAAPQTAYEIIKPDYAGGVFRMAGNKLVLHKTATLPPYCVKTGQRAETSVQRTLYWHHPLLVLLAIFPGILIYAIVALIVRKSATFQFPMTYRARNRLRMLVAIGILSLVGSPVCLIAGIYLSQNQSEVFGFVGFALFAALFINAIVCLILGRLVTPTKITDQFCVVKGVSPQYLAMLPDWPYGVDVP